MENVSNRVICVFFLNTTPPLLFRSHQVGLVAVVTGIEARLVDGRTSSEGRVEILYNGQWGSVCDDSFDQSDADVICKMMGYP